MKLVTFEITPGQRVLRRVGLVVGDQVADLYLATCARLAAEMAGTDPRPIAEFLAPTDLLALLQRGEQAMLNARLTLEYILGGAELEPNVIRPLSSVELLAPLPRPSSIRDFIAFEQHIATASAKFNLGPVPPVWYEMPIYYKGNVNSVIGSETDIVWPSFTEKLDYELELGMVIGRAGKDIAEKDAGAYIAGYTIFNDVSARDMQAREMPVQLGPAKGKDFDTGNVLGPWLVTPDEFDPRSARMVARVNGEVWSEGNAGDMHHSFERMIAHVSMSETIFPGDIFGSGTVGGGSGVEIDRWIQPGDVIELGIEGIGVLRNRVVRRSP
jgi:2-keto-4-pentenoate hydratase/2-oxohepta-3-ene-1,7-dioic acid hydratase in catechol pathway